ncbi:hypothetical protein C4N26_00035 [Faecalibacterium prausnitzii]|uniref:Uncharacterized protein n=1 Tax=Faecalibacterium prausnitzii TaxID=853 RepID=A0A329U206_9FIRM|nr:hypothetical protein C4N26_00035 [Faecalibacterium prausnitzii]
MTRCACPEAAGLCSKARSFAPYRALDVQLRAAWPSNGSPSGATTTTAAGGGNRESLLGQRPARRAQCAADAGSRNPALSREAPERASPLPIQKLFSSSHCWKLATARSATAM